MSDFTPDGESPFLNNWPASPIDQDEATRTSEERLESEDCSSVDVERAAGLGKLPTGMSATYEAAVRGIDLETFTEG